MRQKNGKRRERLKKGHCDWTFVNFLIKRPRVILSEKVKIGRVLSDFFARESTEILFVYLRQMPGLFGDGESVIKNFVSVLTGRFFCATIHLAFKNHIFAGVAQQVEQLIRNQQVMCSNHTTSSKTARFPKKTGCFLVLALYLTCAIKIPIFSAACSCICRVAWV